MLLLEALKELNIQLNIALKILFCPICSNDIGKMKKKYIIWPKAPFHTQFASSGRNFRMVACANKAKLLSSTKYVNEVLPTKFHVNSLEWFAEDLLHY